MTALLHELLLDRAGAQPDAPALQFKNNLQTYGGAAAQVEAFAAGLLGLGLQRQDRVAIFLPKQMETVVAMFGAVRAGCVFVPVNPILKAPQVEHILRDCNVKVLVTSPERVPVLAQSLGRCSDLLHLVLVSQGDQADLPALSVPHLSWAQLLELARERVGHRVIDTDMASILYTSGSTGKPKGVVLSHRNMVTGAASVASYLENRASDRLLAVLPFSFDYGFSQLSTAFTTGASVVLMDYLLPRDVINAVSKFQITGLAGVPPLWSQLAELPWPATVTDHLRYITNSGGAMPRATLGKLRTALPKTLPYLMYGLTEAFRSTYLPPGEVDKRPDSIGKAIPNAEILVVRPDGTACAANEPGELVHRGSLVGLGYWNDPGKTAERFKPTPGRDPALILTEMAVWSGDTVRMDEEGYLYFIGRLDEMIKTSGYRVSPTEVEEVLFASGLVKDAVAVGVPHPTLGQAIAVIVAALEGALAPTDKLLEYCKQNLPNFMVPHHIEWRDDLPRSPNGKYDRPLLSAQMRDRLVRE